MRKFTLLFVVTFALELSIVAQAAPPAASANPRDSTTIKLQEPFTEFHAANGGRQLVFFEKQSQKLAIYDTLSGEELGVISLATPDILFTCGHDSIIVALPNLKILQRYNLETRQRTRSAPSS